METFFLMQTAKEKGWKSVKQDFQNGSRYVTYLLGRILYFLDTSIVNIQIA